MIIFEISGVIFFMENKTYKKLKSVESKDFGDETFLMNIDTEDFFNLNEVGTLVWEKANGKTKVSAVAKQIAKKYGVDEKKVLKDVLDLLKTLESKKLINIS